MSDSIATSDLALLQYPVGRFTKPATLSAAERAAAIAVLAELPGKLAAALKGLDDAQLNTPYRPGGWTIRQVVHHVADSHMQCYSRTRLALTNTDLDQWPAIFAYNQTAWAELADSALPPALSVQLLTCLHQRLVATLRTVPDNAWETHGYMHPENGRQSLSQVLALYAWHSRHHLAHVVNCRQQHGW